MDQNFVLVSESPFLSLPIYLAIHKKLQRDLRLFLELKSKIQLWPNQIATLQAE